MRADVVAESKTEGGVKEKAVLIAPAGPFLRGLLPLAVTPQVCTDPSHAMLPVKPDACAVCCPLSWATKTLIDAVSPGVHCNVPVTTTWRPPGARVASSSMVNAEMLANAALAVIPATAIIPARTSTVRSKKLVLLRMIFPPLKKKDPWLHVNPSL